MAVTLDFSLYRSQVSDFLESGVDINATIYRHGDVYTFAGGATVGDTIRSFAKPAINSVAVGERPANQNNFIFNATEGYPFTVQNDSERGKVLCNTQDGGHYNSILKYQTTDVPENTYLYSSYWQKVYLGLAGEPYPYYFQLKHWRWNETGSQQDNSQLDVKLTSQNQGESNSNLFVKNVNGTDTTWYGGQKAVINNTWFNWETILFTGTVNGGDAFAICRLSQNGVNYIVQKRDNISLYGATERYRYLLMQGYTGNFGVTINAGPSPDVRQISNDSACVIHSLSRFDLSSSPVTQTAARRQVLNHTISGSDAGVIIDTTGWPTGRHYANVRKISGIDSSGWDVVDDYQQIIIEVL